MPVPSLNSNIGKWQFLKTEARPLLQSVESIHDKGATYLNVFKRFQSAVAHRRLKSNLLTVMGVGGEQCSPICPSMVSGEQCSPRTMEGHGERPSTDCARAVSDHHQVADIVDHARGVPRAVGPDTAGGLPQPFLRWRRPHGPTHPPTPEL